MTILIVDDSELIRTMLIDYLAEAGYPVAGAADGLEALKYLHSQPVQFVLLDVMMPIMNGWEMLQTMHADPALATIPVVMMTAAANVREIALEHGATGYLPKPLDVHELLGIVRYHAERWSKQHSCQIKQAAHSLPAVTDKPNQLGERKKASSSPPRLTQG